MASKSALLDELRREFEKQKVDLPFIVSTVKAAMLAENRFGHPNHSVRIMAAKVAMDLTQLKTQAKLDALDEQPEEKIEKIFLMAKRSKDAQTKKVARSGKKEKSLVDEIIEGTLVEPE